MKYVCSICGYVYDDEKEAIPFSELPASWCCPVCGAPKDVFVPAEPEKPKDTDNAGEPQKDVASASPEAAESGDDILGYTAGKAVRAFICRHDKHLPSDIGRREGAG